MQLTDEEKAILNGSQGSVMAKVMRTLVMYGEALQAEKLVEIEGPGHFSIPFCMPGVGPRLDLDFLMPSSCSTVVSRMEARPGSIADGTLRWPAS